MIMKKEPKYNYIIAKTDGAEILKPRMKKMSLREMQKIVGGYIEFVALHPGCPYMVCCNEEGLLKNLPVNPKIKTLRGDIIIGTRRAFGYKD